MKRRNFLGLVGLGIIAAKTPLFGATNPRVVVVGGGFAGATCAKYLKLWGGRSVDVTLIDKNLTYVSPILSNLILNSQKTINDLTFDYATHQERYLINYINGLVDYIDFSNKTVRVNGENIPYDKLVLAPGIDFIYTNDYDVSKVPHAWIAGEQTLILKQQIDSLKDGDTFLLSIPKAPYRCPPGPYERACVVADYLKNIKGLNVNVIVLDENPDIVVEKDTFGSKFLDYGIDYRPNTTVLKVDDVNMSVDIDENGKLKVLKSNVLNVIPNQRAGKIVFNNSLNIGRWAAVDPISYESTIQKDVYIIGDSQNSSQPKAGHIGNGEAKVCADAILRSLNGYALYPTPKTNSACYSPVSSTEASWLAAVFVYDKLKKDMKLVYSQAGMPSRKNYKDMFNWSGNLFADTFM